MANINRRAWLKALIAVPLAPLAYDSMRIRMPLMDRVVDRETGISIRFVKIFDSRKPELFTRWDCFYGMPVPEGAVSDAR